MEVLVFFSIIHIFVILHQVFSCPVGCNCDFNKVQCSGKALETFTELKKIPSKATWLDFMNNNIKDITLKYKSGSVYPNVKHLYLDYNQITKLPTQNESLLSVFAGLKHLFLSYNKIKHITRGVFRGLRNLQELRLSNNKIERLSGHSFEGLHQLIVLHLQENVIADMDEDAFLGLQNLQHLDLSNNRLIEIDDACFQSVPMLDTVHFGNNHIATFKPENFRWPDGVKKLDLHNNNLQVIPPLPTKNCDTQQIDNCQKTRAKVLLQGNDIYCGCRRPEHGRSMINKLLPVLSVCCIDVKKVCPKASNGKTPQNYSSQLFKSYLNGPVCRKPLLEIDISKKHGDVCVAEGEPIPAVTETRECTKLYKINDYKPVEIEGVSVTCTARNVFGNTKMTSFFIGGTCGTNESGAVYDLVIQNETNEKLPKCEQSPSCEIFSTFFIFPAWSVILICFLSFAVLTFMLTIVLFLHFQRENKFQIDFME